MALLDQTNRYSDLSLKEEDLLEGGKHILVAYTMTPATGYGYLEAASHFAAESSTGTNVEVSTTDDFTKGVDALVYEIDEAKEIMKIAYPNELFDRNIIDGRTMIVSFLTLAIGNNQGMGDIKQSQMFDFYVPPKMLQLFDGPAMDISDLWRILGRPIENGGYISGTIIKPKLGLRPKPFAEAAISLGWVHLHRRTSLVSGQPGLLPDPASCYPSGCRCLPAHRLPDRRSRSFSANITADDHHEMCAPVLGPRT